MKLKLLCTCKLGQHGSIVDIDRPEQARQLIAKRVAEEYKPVVEVKPEQQTEKKTKGGKKPAQKIETK